MYRDTQRKGSTGWKPLSDAGKRGAQEREQNPGKRPSSPEDSLPQKRRLNHDPASTKDREVAHAGGTPFNQVVHSSHLDSTHFQIYRPRLSYTDMNAGTHHSFQSTINDPCPPHDPALPAHVHNSTSANMPPDYSQPGLYPRHANHTYVPGILRVDANAPYAALGISRPLTAPYSVQSVAGASALTLAPKSVVFDPDPFLYIDSLRGYHLPSKGSPGDQPVVTAYFHGPPSRTILAMRLAHFKREEWRIATRCVHHRNHTPGEWEAFIQPNGGSSPRDHPLERESCFMTELGIEERLPSQQELKRVWMNSYNLALAEKSSKVRNALLPPKDDMTDWDVPERAFQLTAGYMMYHLEDTNPGSQTATILLSKNTGAFDELSSPGRVSVAASFVSPPCLLREHVTVLTNRHWPVTDPVPNLTVGSVDLTNA